MTSKKIKIGTNSLNYSRVRNFANLPFQKYEVTKSYDFFRILNHLYIKSFSTHNELISNLYCDFGLSRQKLMHFFNTISISNTPWVVTFETFLPRWGIITNFGLKYGVKLLANASCKKLIAISQCTYDIQCRYLESFPEYKEDIINKMCVIHPAQKLLVDSYDMKELDDKHITFTIVGHLFFRKGGKEILTVFNKLIQQGHPLRLNIVSSMQYGDDASKTSAEDLRDAQKIIQKFPNNIVHYPFLPNKKVLEMLNRTQIGLLPTYADTYGYFVLESQASGCPIITTDVRALPEINNNQYGWIINIPKDNLGNTILKTEKDRIKISNIIEDNLYKIIHEIVENPHIIKEKGTRCLERIKEFHSPEVKAREMESIYDEVLIDKIR